MNEEQIGTIERLKRQLEWYDRTLEEKQKEITKRDKIIKEIREWSKKLQYETINASTRRELLEILDKENI